MLDNAARPDTARETDVLLAVSGLRKNFPVKLGFRRRGHVSAVDGVSFAVQRGTTLGIVGESGCGKSTAARLLLGLVEPDAGDLSFDGLDLREMWQQQRKRTRREMQMVFQDPYSSLNPRMSIGENIGFPLRVHGHGRGETRQRVGELLTRVGLHQNHASYFPHQLSGGQRQRANIARALALQPKLVIADEAVSALDKSVQAQVLNLLKDLQDEHHLTYIFISHDLNVVEYMSNRVAVMYLGQVVEIADADELYRRPLHPYSRALLAASPVVDPDSLTPDNVLEGEIPSPLQPPSGCRFRTRCPLAMVRCAEARPPLIAVEAGHEVACVLYEQGAPAAAAAAQN
jgi:oligopeptide/dipeptide ABC transporter ATP-binding protein